MILSEKYSRNRVFASKPQYKLVDFKQYFFTKKRIGTDWSYYPTDKMCDLDAVKKHWPETRPCIQYND